MIIINDWIKELFIKEFILRDNKSISKQENPKQTNLRSIYYKKDAQPKIRYNVPIY